MIMKRILVIVTVVLLLAVGVSIVHAQSGYDLFQKGAGQGARVGTSKKRFVSPAHRQGIQRQSSVGAKAELRMGLLYDRLAAKPTRSELIKLS